MIHENKDRNPHRTATPTARWGVGERDPRWPYGQGVALDFSRPGKPTDNAFIESFNGRLRDECLNTHWFLCLDDIQTATKNWREEYNRERPHSALGHLTPEEFAAQQIRPTMPKMTSELA